MSAKLNPSRRKMLELALMPMIALGILACEADWRHNVLTDGATAAATVIKARRRKFGGGSIDFEFETPDRRVIQGNANVDSSELAKLKVGDRFPVVYLKRDPDLNRTEWAADRLPYSSSVVLIFLMGLWFPFASIYLIEKIARPKDASAPRP